MADAAHAEKDLNASIAWGLGVTVKVTGPDPRDPSTILHAGQRWPAGNPGAWKDSDAYQDGARAGGSENWPLDALAAKILIGSPAEKAEADASAIRWLTEQKVSRGWMGREIGSRVYGWMHLEAALIFYREGSSALRQLAGEWLDIWFFWMRIGWDAKLKRVLWIGQRSCLPGRDAPQVEDDLAAWINGEAAFPARGGTLDRLIIYALRPVLEECQRRLRDPEPWAMATPVTFWRGDDGVAVCVAQEVNSNTSPVLGASTVGDKISWGPALPWQVIHLQSLGGRCESDGNSMRYSAARVYPPATLPLPTVNVRRYRLGAASPTTSQAPPPSPANPRPVPATAAKPSMASRIGCLLPLIVLLALVLAALVLHGCASSGCYPASGVNQCAGPDRQQRAEKECEDRGGHLAGWIFQTCEPGRQAPRMVRSWSDAAASASPEVVKQNPRKPTTREECLIEADFQQKAFGVHYPVTKEDGPALSTIWRWYHYCLLKAWKVPPGQCVTVSQPEDASFMDSFGGGEDDWELCNTPDGLPPGAKHDRGAWRPRAVLPPPPTPCPFDGEAPDA